MISGQFSRFCLFTVALGTLGQVADAAIPPTYTGTPYLGTPRSIPGRIDMEEYDLGGVNVAWKCDNKAGAAGSSAATRANDGEAQHPGFYYTNNNPGEAPDVYTGTTNLYPSAASPKSIYIGATHATDWVHVTVDVKKTGTYWISSTFAAENTQAKFSVSFNGVKKATGSNVANGIISLPAANNFHFWKKYDDCAKVQLDSGIQVMKFLVEGAHLNWDYISFSADSGVAVGIQSPKAKAKNDLQVSVFSSINNQKTIQYSLPIAGQTHISLFNSLGHEVKSVQEGLMKAGSHTSILNMSGLQEGVYFLNITHNQNHQVIRLQHIH